MSFPALDVAIGLSFTYFLFSVLATAVTETISRFMKQRARMLERWIGEVLSNPDTGEEATDIVAEFYATPIMRVLHVSTGSATKQAKRSKKLGLPSPKSPSYIPSTHFVAAVLHTGRETAAGVHTAKQTWDVDRPRSAASEGHPRGRRPAGSLRERGRRRHTLPPGCRGLVRRPDGAVVRRLQALVVVDHLGHQPDHRGGPERELAAHGRDPLERPDRARGAGRAGVEHPQLARPPGGAQRGAPGPAPARLGAHGVLRLLGLGACGDRRA